MKKIILIIIFLLVQSYPSFGNVNGKGLICKCSHMIMKSRHSQVSEMDLECQFLVPIYFKENKVFIKYFEIIRDKVLLKDLPISRSGIQTNILSPYPSKKKN